MGRISKRELKLQEEVLAILQKDVLSYEEKVFVLKNFNEAMISEISHAGAFFTPYDLANDFVLDIPVGHNTTRVLDMCAGIGGLSFHIANHHGFERSAQEIVCVEINPDFVEIGKKIVPEATWVCGDILDKELIDSLGQFYGVYGNPPFGNIKTASDDSWLSYSGREFEFKVIEVGARLADMGAFILPQMSCPFSYSGQNGFQWKGYSSSKLKKWIDQTGVELSHGVGIDTCSYENSWKNTKIVVESVCFSLSDQDVYSVKILPQDDHSEIEINVVEVQEEAMKETKEKISQLALF